MVHLNGTIAVRDIFSLYLQAYTADGLHGDLGGELGVVEDLEKGLACASVR